MPVTIYNINFRAWDLEDKIMLNWNLLSQSAFPKLMYDVLVGNASRYEKNLCSPIRDKNSKRIYENDIIRDDVSKKVYLVKYGRSSYLESTGWYVSEIKGTKVLFINTDHGSDVNSRIEIIGNIYEKKELLD